MVKLVLISVSLSAGLWAALETRAAIVHAVCVVHTATDVGSDPEAAAERRSSCD